MPKQIRAKDGDSVESIAFAHGHFWQTVWDYPDNEQLKAERQEPNILEENDLVVVPDLRPKQVDKAVDQRYRFKRKGVPSMLRVRMMDWDKPRVGLAYKVNVKGKITEGQTDGDGWVKCYLMPDATEGVLEFPAINERYEFTVGDVRPHASLRGVQARLRNLGFYAGEVDGEESEEFVSALRLYQRVREIEETGRADAATIAELESEHGS
jgi:N-acetylmuramoyl-L-alanine amidase